MVIKKQSSGFTLLELLIVIGILAVLSAVTVLVINPVEFLKKARDSTRLSDIQNINSAVLLFQVDNSSASLGASSTVYVSLVDASSTCSNSGLPSLPSGWTYNCVTTADDLQKVDGNGWIPLNFQSMAMGSPFSVLPVDPKNTTSTGLYYTYTPGGSWELTAAMESDKYKGEGSAAGEDGGDHNFNFETGTSLNLTPSPVQARAEDSSLQDGLVAWWSFDEGSGTTANDSSENSNSGTLYNDPAWVTGKQGSALSFDGSNDYVDVPIAVFNQDAGSWHAWVNIEDNSNSGNIRIFTSDHSLGGAYEFRTYTTVSGVLYFYLGNGTTITMAGISALFNKWEFITWTWEWDSGTDQTVLKGYLNGVYGNQNTFSGKPSIPDMNIHIGNWLNSRFYKGLIDEFRIYNRALSASEIQAIYNATK